MRTTETTTNTRENQTARNFFTGPVSLTVYFLFLHQPLTELPDGRSSGYNHSPSSLSVRRSSCLASLPTLYCSTHPLLNLLTLRVSCPSLSPHYFPVFFWETSWLANVRPLRQIMRTPARALFRPTFVTAMAPPPTTYPTTRSWWSLPPTLRSSPSSLAMRFLGRGPNYGLTTGITGCCFSKEIHTVTAVTARMATAPPSIPCRPFGKETATPRLLPSQFQPTK